VCKLAKTSKIEGFYKLPLKDRTKFLKEFAGLTDEEVKAISNTGALKFDQVDRMIENVVGTMPVPLGIAVNFLINGKDYLVPMAIEEPSVVAAASYMAKLVRKSGGFHTNSTPPLMIGQIQLVSIEDPFATKMRILSKKDEILKLCNDQDPLLVKVGGGAKDIDVRIVDTIKGQMVILHLIVDVRDAMGANAVNTMAEAVAPFVEKITGGKVYLRIISNLAVYRLARAWCVVNKDVVGGEEVVDGIIRAYALAAADPYRTATHNKGIMNGITAVVLATGNDTRAVEAGAHAYAAHTGRYTSLTKWEKNKDGDLAGSIEIPMAIGLIGGATKVHPTAQINIKILGVKSASELGEVIAAVGLAQNLAALRALTTEGIQKGHMELHARNIAITAGATPDVVDTVVAWLVKEKKIRMDRAKEIIEELKR
jgi:hydroxymethylglutaryl-CoA reductase